MSAEESWGRTFERRGSVTIRNMPNKAPTTIRKLSTEDVAELYRSEGAHDHPSLGGILAGAELRRRENWTARAAISISILSLAVAIASLFAKHDKVCYDRNSYSCLAWVT